ncbi:hypothetical protein NUW54_g4062 [Trametes sanguinea]|uniref:Uncharacterized protein n=1 Tax=Trametes sanguinea TaxID=158606 RepID=A0ACC1PYZ0_9APHY|nr:hypothetical protein NUW54_g4062 [Trametes sanguinea]
MSRVRRLVSSRKPGSVAEVAESCAQNAKTAGGDLWGASAYRVAYATTTSWTSTTTTAASAMSATAASPEAAAQLLFPPNVQYNNARLYTVKFLSSCFAGAVAGVLGLENTLGFALFIFSTLFTAACLYVKCKGRPAKFVPGGWWELVNPGRRTSSRSCSCGPCSTVSCTVRSQQHVIQLSDRYQWNIHARSIRLNHRGGMGAASMHLPPGPFSPHYQEDIWVLVVMGRLHDARTASRQRVMPQ